MNRHRVLNLIRCSYFNCRVFGLLLACLIGLSACDTNPEATGLGSLAGVVQLDVPDATTGHAGILIYLAGTPYQSRTDQQGRYRMDGIPAGTYDLAAEKAGFQGLIIEDVMINPAVHKAESPLQPAPTTLAAATASADKPTSDTYGTIRGRVLLQDLVDENGGVRVEVDGTAFVTVSSNDGQFRLLNVDPGTYTLSFYKDGFRPYKSEAVDVSSGTITIPEVALEMIQPGDPVSPALAAAAVAARNVPAATPAPPPGPTEARSVVGLVELIGSDGQVTSDYSAVTVAINGTDRIAEVNEQGQFRIDNLTSGTYTLIGAVENGPTVQIPVDLVSLRTATVTVKLNLAAAVTEAIGAISGTVVLVDPDNEPLGDSSGVQVAVNGTQVIATTAADGSFTLQNVPAGTHTITASRDTFDTAEVPDVTVAASAPANVGEIRLTQKVDRPRVLSTVPAHNAKDVVVGYDLPIQIKFSARMNAASVKDAISLSPATPYTAIMGKGAGTGADDDTIVLQLSNDDPKSPIQFGATYRITVADTAASMEGVTMAEPYTFSFRTSSPGVIQVTPQNGENRAFVDQLENPVLFTFNTKLDPESINDRNIRVRPDNGMSVATTYTDSDVNGWTTIRVATNWQPDTQYTVTISRRVKAFNGQPLGNTPYTLRFRTAPLEIMTMPILESR